MRVTPYDGSGSHKTGSLSSKLSLGTIIQILGFAPNVDDDESKVTASWGFKVDGVYCAIWDYKGSRWSTFGPREKFIALFGEENVGE